MILTGVVPAYNVERFLEKTLSSFVFDKISGRVEIITVDDGSSDRTAEIARSYEEKYPGVFRTISKENGGHGSTINRGAEAARGKYFKVVDGDDWVDSEAFEKLTDFLEASDADCVVSNYCEVNDATGEMTPVEYNRFFPERRDMQFSELAGSVSLALHSMTLRTEILKNNPRRLDEHCFYVDVEYILFQVPYLRSVAFCDANVYRYRIAQQAQSVSLLGFQKHVGEHALVSLRLAEFAREYEQAEGAERAKAAYITERTAQMAVSQAMIFQSFPHGDRKVLEKFKKYDSDLKRTNEAVYLRSSALSPTLRLLRKFRFRFYRPILWARGKVLRKS